MNVESQRRIFVEPWSESIHIALWRNHGLLHSFHDFSKSNAFWQKQSLFSIKFSFEWVYFWGVKPRGYSSIYIKNYASRFSAYKNNYCHDTGRSFEPIFMKLTRLRQVHTWVDPIFLETIGPIETLIWGKMCPQNWVFGFHSASMEFLREKFQSRILYPISYRKGHINFCRWTLFSEKLFFVVILENIVFFPEKIEKYSKPHFLQKSLYWFLSSDTPFPLKWSCRPTNGFSQFLQHKLKNIREVVLLEGILIRKKILRRINFLFIKFLPNALLFEKLQNECKNPSFLHMVTCIMSDQRRSCQVSHSWLYNLGGFGTALIFSYMMSLII